MTRISAETSQIQGILPNGKTKVFHQARKYLALLEKIKIPGW